MILSGTSNAAPFSLAGPRVYEQGFRPLPILPIQGIGSPGRGKAPGACEPINGSLIGVWEPMTGWQEWAEKDQSEDLIEHWSTWPNANVGVLLDRTIGAVDIDVDDPRVQAAVMATFEGLGGEIVKKMGGIGFTVFFRQPDSGPVENASYSFTGSQEHKDGKRAVDLLSLGRQTVIPPSMHVSGKPYRWLTPETLENTDPSELPQVTDDFPEVLQEALRPFRVFRGTGSRAKARKPPANGSVTTTGAGQVEVDLDPMTRQARADDGWMSAVNDRAMEPAEMAKWAPALGLPKFHSRGSGSYRAVASWRPSATGRAIPQRSANLGISPHGIEDFGSGDKFTAIDLVMRAMDLPGKDAADWLTEIMDAGFSVPAQALEALQESGPVRAQETSLQVVPDAEIEDDDDGSDDGEGRWWGGVTLADYYAEFPSDPGPFPEEAIRGLMGGALRELTELVERRSASPSFHCAFGTALSYLSAATGQLYGVGNTRTNMYIVLIGESGLGKTAATSVLDFIANKGGRPELANLIGPTRLTSDAAMVKQVRSKGRVLMFWDEFGHKLKSFNSKHAKGWETRLIMLMTEFYSVAHGVWGGIGYAGEREDEEPIESPHLCFFGTSTEDQFWDAISSKNLEDGSLARYQIIDAGSELPELPNDPPEPITTTEASAIADRLADIVRGPYGANAGAMAGLAPAYQIGLPDHIRKDQWERRRRYRAFANVTKARGISGAGPLIQRSLELATKIAMINAVAKNAMTPAITDEDWSLGLLLAHWSISRMISSVYDKVAETEQEGVSKEIELYIKKRPKGVSKRDISNAKRKYKKRDRDEVLEDLVDAGLIYKDKVQLKNGSEEWRLFHRDRLRVVK